MYIGENVFCNKQMKKKNDGYWPIPMDMPGVGYNLEKPTLILILFD